MNRKVREQTGTEETEASERAERLPLDDVDPRILDIAFHAVFAPRSIAGKYQWDGLMYVILNTMADLEKGIKKISFEEFIAAFSKSFEGVTSENEGRLSVYFKEFAERLEYLENPRTPTNGDIAVDALQDAFMGLTSGQYGWGKKGFPTKGEVTQMAKTSLMNSGRNVRKAGWTALLREAHLGWLPKGEAGRPSKAEVDENAKAARECHTILTQAINDNNIYGGNAIRLRDALPRRAETVNAVVS
jgi:hypothetical protein